jgi:hypothetical protein
MSDNPVPGTPSVTEIQARLDHVSQLLRESRSIDARSRKELKRLVEELGSILQSGDVAPAEAASLAETAAHLAEALQHRHDSGRLAQLRDRIERGVLAAEAEAPVTSGVVMQLLDVLANLGI